VTDFTIFHTFFSVLTDNDLIFGTLLCHTKIQIKIEFGFDPLILNEVITLGFRKISQIFSFAHIFSLSLQIFIWYLVHCFAILSCKSNSIFVLIHLFFMKLWPLDLQKYYKLSVFAFAVTLRPQFFQSHPVASNDTQGYEEYLF
jgi:hypothetical protein